jgi:hypothetical protein
VTKNNNKWKAIALILGKETAHNAILFLHFNNLQAVYVIRHETQLLITHERDKLILHIIACHLFISWTRTYYVLDEYESAFFFITNYSF